MWNFQDDYLKEADPAERYTILINVTLAALACKAGTPGPSTNQLRIAYLYIFHVRE